MSRDDKIIDYAKLVDEAMYFIVYKALKIVEHHGVIADHHFLISFLTNYQGVILSDRLRAKYPHEMMIVLQHQFNNLVVHHTYFETTLSFSGISEKISVPFAAITTFADPSVQFCLEFSAPMHFENATYPIFQRKSSNLTKNGIELDVATSYDLKESKVPDNVVLLEEFRRMRNK